VGFIIAVGEVSVLGCDAVNLSTLQDESSAFSRNVESQVPRSVISQKNLCLHCHLLCGGGKKRIVHELICVINVSCRAVRMELLL